MPPQVRAARRGREGNWDGQEGARLKHSVPRAVVEETRILKLNQGQQEEILRCPRGCWLDPTAWGFGVAEGHRGVGVGSPNPLDSQLPGADAGGHLSLLQLASGS